MNRNILRNIFSILKETPLCRTLPRHEKRSLIRGVPENYLFPGDGEGGEIVGYESSWAGLFKQGAK
ncbi:MAG TPA: hypothetical protein VJW95_04935 [Dissulfurispiraceae bacterium]|nr:hypothetical protein [Dissulfurispiraceae bacterium]